MVRTLIKRLVDSFRGDGHHQRRAYRVAPWLLVGPALTAEGYIELKDRGLTHILDLREEETHPIDVAPVGVRRLEVPIRDRSAPSFEQFAEIAAWVALVRAGEGVVYVHCQGGLGRAPTISIALMMDGGFGLRDAFQLVLAARPGAAPTEPQQEWLRALALTLPGDGGLRTTGDSGSPPRSDGATD